MSPQAVYDLGRDWYATRLDPQFEPASLEQTQATFTRHGLVDSFWLLAP